MWKRGRHPVETRLRDLSADGMFLQTEAPFPVNQVMDLLIALPSGPVSVLAVSRLCGTTQHGTGIGASILAMEPLERARWIAHYRHALDQAAKLGAESNAHD